MYRLSLLLSCAAAATFVHCGGSSKPAGTSNTREPMLSQDDEAPTSRRSRTPGMDEEEDESDDGMQVTGLKGHLDPYDIQAGVTPHSSKLAGCFQGKAKKKQFLGGRVEFGFTIARDGSVKKVQVVKSDVGAWDVERCLLETGASMGFKKPKGGEADFSLPLDFEARRSPNWWTEEQAETELGALPAELDSCEKESGAMGPRNVWVTLYLGNRGVIQSVGFASPHKQGIAAEWIDCAAEKVAAWTLSDPRGKIAKLSFRYKPE